MSDFLPRQEYFQLDTRKELINLCRTDIVSARLVLAAKTDITLEQERDLWQIIDCREWFLKMVVCDFGAELEQIDRELEAELRR